MRFSLKSWRKVLMGVCDVSLIISDENPCKLFSNNSQNYGSSYTEYNINKALLILCLALGKLSDEKKNSLSHLIK